SFFFQAEDGIRDFHVTGVQTCALPIYYFERIYQFAEELIGKGLAYVCSLSEEDARRMRGSIAEAGTPSPDRDRPIAESLALFRQIGRASWRGRVERSGAAHDVDAHGRD